MPGKDTKEHHRLRLLIQGHVQGVGFRPFVYRLATELGLTGYVLNSPQGVVVEVEGPSPALQSFQTRLHQDRPPHVVYASIEMVHLPPVGYGSFTIRSSEETGPKQAWILPDLATCSACLQEIFDPRNRRYLYPFTNCTHCGPRFTILESLPYDRPNTTMRHFTMCRACREEYEDPSNRRFHTQPNACWECGPQVALWDPQGRTLAQRQEAMARAVALLRDGAILAVKGLGGFHLMVRADAADSIRQLRTRKRRDQKPFALMYPNLEVIETVCEVSPTERQVLQSPAAPIVLLQRRSTPLDSRFVPADEVAPGLTTLGIMLPYTPLHHILLRELGLPVVATSGNLSDEPICTDEHEALQRLAGIADFFLVHNRPIARHADDSIVQVVEEREIVLRRARGYVPSPILIAQDLSPTLAVGGHLKNTVALARGRRVFLSQHIGDLDTPQARATHRRVIQDLEQLLDIRPTTTVCDLHPDYASTRMAEQLDRPLLRVQHHLAHVLACRAENEIQGPCLGVAWDGTGYGPDGTVWGGEFFLVTEKAGQRVAHFRHFPLPGGEAAVREPRRSALGLLYAWKGEALFTAPYTELAPLRSWSPQELTLLHRLLQRNRAPQTSSVGRLFDAVAAILGLRQRSYYEGQAAMELESRVDPQETQPYPIRISPQPVDPKQLADPSLFPPPLQPVDSVWIVDWAPMLEALLRDLQTGIPLSVSAARFHLALAEAIVLIADRVQKTLCPDFQTVALTGGCFQNRYLLREAVRRLQQAGWNPVWHQRVPPGDGGLALGQTVAAAYHQAKS